jgi:riboflavin kinase/FMN adenylyltransferase
MKVSSLPDVEPGSGPRKVAIGTFDGVHRGHREVIRGADTVLTFDPHPLAVIHPEATPKLISTSAVKRDLIAGLGVEELVVIPFDKGFSSQKGTPEFLHEHDDFETRVVPLVEAAGETISSSHIRGLVAAGEVGPAAEFLGGPFLFEGVVVPGDRRGRELGMPTANLVPDERFVVPGHGVYAAWTHGYPAAVNVGVRPTFDTGRGLLVEAHLIGFEGDLYGETLRIAFLDRLRGERRFESVDELVEQMNRDVEDAKRIAEAAHQP